MSTNCTKATGSTAAAAPTFQDIKTILDWLVKGKRSRLKIYHGLDFHWETLEALQAAQVVLNGNPPQVFRLIEPDKVGNGRANETYLMQALTVGVAGRGRMPKDGNDEGKYASPEQLDTIRSWIDSGMPA